MERRKEGEQDIWSLLLAVMSQKYSNGDASRQWESGVQEMGPDWRTEKAIVLLKGIKALFIAG